MNQLEKIAHEHPENYALYLERMNISLTKSTKSYLPLYTIGKTNILDVGCADGQLMKKIQQVNPSAYVYGIDINQQSVDKAVENRCTAYCLSIDELPQSLENTFDCIIFSSVLHEISSYSNEPYSTTPITNALKRAYKLLTSDGIIIIRDGLRDTSNELCKLQFVNKEDEQWLKRFREETQYPGYYYEASNEYVCSTSLAQEFLATWTWGPDSWDREVKERFCLLSEDYWQWIVQDAGFEIQFLSKSKEEYPKFLLPKVKISTPLGNEPFFPFMTCTIIAKK